MPIKFANNLQSRIADVGGLGPTGMSFSLTAGDGAKLLARIPDLGTDGVYCYARIKDALAQRETVKIGSVSGDVCTITERAVETEDVALTFAQNDIVHFVSSASGLLQLVSDALSLASAYADSLVGSATAAELSELHGQGVSAAAFAKLAQIVSTAAELSALNGQGCIAADFAKLHGITVPAYDINAICANQSLNATGIRIKPIDLPVWNMDTVDSIAVAHGIAYPDQFVGCACCIRADGGTYYPLPRFDSFGAAQGWVDYRNADNILIKRLTGGSFDNSGFDDALSRGYLLVFYYTSH